MLPLKDLTSTQSESAAIPSSPCAINTRVKNCWSSGRGSRWRISTIPAIPFVLRNTRARRRRFPRGRREEPLIAIHVAEVEGILGSSKSGLWQHIQQLAGQTNVTVRFYNKIAAALWGELFGLGRKARTILLWAVEDAFMSPAVPRERGDVNVPRYQETQGEEVFDEDDIMWNKFSSTSSII